MLKKKELRHFACVSAAMFHYYLLLVRKMPKLRHSLAARLVYAINHSLTRDETKIPAGINERRGVLLRHHGSTRRELYSSRGMSVSVADQQTGPEITVDPGGHLLMDEELHISVHRLGSGQVVTIYTTMRERWETFESCCVFKADHEGVVDLYNHPSLSGSYTGVSPMGIFWSLTPTPEMRKGTRLIGKDMDKPMVADVMVYRGNLTADEVRATVTNPVANISIERWYKGQGVTSEELTDGRLRGKLFMPAGSGPFPGVIDMFGTAGGLVEFRSALLASRGIASLALPYFLYKDLPKTLFDVELEYFLEAVSWLRKHPKVYGEGVGVVGVSKGGDIGFMMATYCPEVRAFVNINGCTFNTNYPMKYNGDILPAVVMDLGKIELIEEAYAWCNAYDYSVEDLQPVWRHNPKILNILSEDDKCSPNECIRLMQRHYPPDKADNYVILSYPGAGHLMEPPYTPCCRMSYHKFYDSYFLWGGQPWPHAKAQEDSWKKILEFLHKNIPKTGPINSN